MAPVNPALPVVNPQQTLQLSRGTIAAPGESNAFASLFEGAVSLGTQAVDAVDFVIDKTFKAQATEQLAEQNRQSQELAQAVAGRGLNVGDFEKLTSNVPDEVKQNFKTLDNLRKQKNAGQLINTAYWSNVQSIVSTLKQRFPGYGQDIDTFMKAQTGAVPANALRRSLVQEASTAVTASARSAEKFEKFLFDNAEHIRPTARAEFEKTGDQNKLKSHILQNVSNEGTEEAWEQRLKRSTRDAKQFGAAAANVAVNGPLGDSLKLAFGVEDISEISDAVIRLNSGQSTGLLRLDEGTMGPLLGSLQVARARAVQLANEKITKFGTLQGRQLEDGNVGPDRLLITGAEREDMLKNAMSNFDTIIDIVKGKKDISMLGHVAAMMELNVDVGSAAQLDQKDIFRAAVTKNILGEGIAGLVFGATGAYSKIVAASEATKYTDITFRMLGNGGRDVESGVARPRSALADTIERYKDEESITDPRIFKTTIQMFQNMATIDQTDPENVKDFSKVLKTVFANDGGKMLGLFKRGERIKIVNTMASPKVFRAVQERAKTDPSVMVTYSDWLRTQTRTIFGGSLEAFKESAQQAGGQITYDGTTGLFDIQGQDNVPNIDVTGEFGPGRKAVDDMNQAMRLLKPIVDQEEGDKNKEVRSILRQAGFKVDDIIFTNIPEDEAANDVTGGSNSLPSPGVPGLSEGLNQMGLDINKALTEVTQGIGRADELPGKIASIVQSLSQGGNTFGGSTFGGQQFGGLTPQEIFAGGDSVAKEAVVANTKAPVTQQGNPARPDEDAKFLGKFQYDNNLLLPSDREVSNIQQRSLEEGAVDAETIELQGEKFTVEQSVLDDNLITGSIKGKDQDEIAAKIAQLNLERVEAVKVVGNFIGSVEAPGGYDQVFGGGTEPLTDMTVMQVLALQSDMTRVRGLPSSAVGKYQAIRGTLAGFISKHKVSPLQKFDKDFQDFFFFEKLRERGLDKYRTGKIKLDAFSKAVAQEWASMPVLNNIKGHFRQVKRGQSYYAGDGLNKALVSPQEFEKMLKGLKM